MRFGRYPLLVLLLSQMFVSQASGQPGKLVRIGVVIDGSWDENSQLLQTIQQEVYALTSGEFNIQFPPENMIQANWTLQSIRSAIDRLLSDREVDMILTLGSISSQEVCSRRELPKPVIAPFIVDAELQDVPIESGKSGIRNLNYISEPSPLERDLDIFREIVPFNKCAILLNEHYLRSYPEFEEHAERLFQALNLEIQIIGMGASVHEPLIQLEDDIEAVYILPLPFLSREDFESLATELIRRRLPSFSYLGAERVEQGILAGLNKDMLNRIARRVAINVQRILLGDPPESIPVAISIRKQLTINDATSRAIEVYPSWAVVTEAEIVGRVKGQDKHTLNLNSTVQEALAANLSLAAKDYYVEAGNLDIKAARSKLRPSMDLSSTYLIVDRDRAENSFGQQPERTLSGSVTANQVIFSEKAWAYLSIQKNLQKTRGFEYEQLRLDIIRDAATAYLNVLRAKTYERIQLANLRLTRHNLELARVREIIGSGGPAEVYRWESQIALNRKSVIEANSQRNLTEIQVNRLLHRPVEGDFVTSEADLDDPVLITSHKTILRYIENRRAFRIFRGFMVEEGLRNSPELGILDATIAARQRALQSATYSFWTPTVGLEAQLENKFSKKGAGLDIPPGFAEPKDLSWHMGVIVSFPLYQGGEKAVQRQKIRKELDQLQAERDALAEIIEQRIRSALHVAGASHASIQQARLAAEAANKSLEVVQDLYSKGVVSIVDLLDVQNSALMTDEAAANAVYDFLIDLMEVERAFGSSDFLASEDEREAFLTRAEDYFEKADFNLTR